MGQLKKGNKFILRLKKNSIFSDQIRTVYFVVCLLGIICIGGNRSAPVYGKLDFLLLNSKPWWPEWRPMVINVLQQGKQPVYTDPITSIILKGVFGQETVFFKKSYQTPILYVERMDLINEPDRKMLPAGALSLLFKNDSFSKKTANDIFSDYVNMIRLGGRQGFATAVKKSFPYRCIVNVHGFIPTWVSYETGHWNPRLADTKWFYRYHYTHVSDIAAELKAHPPKNCEVFF